MLADAIIIVGAGAAVWWAGTRLSRDADQLAAATGWGRVLIGALLLGIATSLPEVATTVTAGVLGNPQLALGNLMGGVAMQIVVLAVADVIESDERLMFHVTRPTVLFQHGALLVLLAMAIAGMVAGEPVDIAGIGLWPLAIAVTYVGSVVLVKRYEGRTGWTTTGQEPPLADEVDAVEIAERPPTWRMVAFGAVLLVGGYLVARSGDALSGSPLLSGTFIGAAVVALTTSLPELSTVIGALRLGSHEMAVSNIMGTNGLEVALLLVADASFRDGPILARATPGDVFLAALAAVLTGVYLCALLLREERSVLRIGYDSAAVIVLYLAGLGILAAIG